MDIRPIEIGDDDEVERYHQIGRDAELFNRPDAPYPTVHETRVMLRSEDPFEELTAYAAFDGETMVGAAMTVFTLLDNVDKAFLLVQVTPSERRRGIGSALLEHLVEVCTEAGRPILLAECWTPFGQRETHPDALFARKHRFQLANVEVRRVLALPVPETQLDAWSAESAAHSQGYPIQTFVDEIPDELLQSLCDVSNQLAVDAPTGDVDLEIEGLTPEAYKIRQAILTQQDRIVYTTVALDPQGSEAVAYSTLMVPRRQPRMVQQWGTLVRSDHRGHRLGLAVKVANLRAVQTAHPDRKFVETTNAETNAPMVAINETMGFTPVELLTEFQRKLADV